MNNHSGNFYLVFVISIMFLGIIATANAAETALDNEANIGDVSALIENVKTKDDVFKSLEINDAKNRNAVFKMNSPVALSKDKLSFTFNEVCGKVNGYSITILDTCYKDVTHYNYSTEETCYDIPLNESNSNTVSCVNETIQTVDYIESVSYDCWKKVNEIPAGNNNYKIDADIRMAICDDGNLGYRIDWVPSLELDSNKKFEMTDWAWWNLSYKYKYNVNITAFAIKTFFYINGSNGVNINGTIVYPLAQTTSGSVSLYFNNATDYAVIENDSVIQTILAPSNLLSYYRFDGNAYDYFGRNNGTATNTNNVSGYIGQAYNFANTGSSAASSYVTLDHNWGDINNFTVSAMVNFNSLSCTSECDVFGIQTTPEWNFFKFGLHASHPNTVFFFMGGGATNYMVKSSISISPNTWYNIVAVKKGTVLELYINGYNYTQYISSGGLVYQVNTSSAQPKIGTVGGVTDNGVPAIIDDVRVWNKSLNATEILDVYNNYNNTLGYGNVFSYDYIAVESQGREAIKNAVKASKIGSSYLPYEDQQIYERLLNGSQYVGTFDYLIVSGNKRYAFNYDENSLANLPHFYNITPVLYVWQGYNLTVETIYTNVITLINSTYS
jgi:hypothetical protein